MKYLKLFENFDITEHKEDIEDYLLEMCETLKLKVSVRPCITKDGVYNSMNTDLLHSNSNLKLGVAVSINKSEERASKGEKFNSDDVISIYDRYKLFISRIKDKYMIDFRQFNLTQNAISISIVLTPKEEVEIKINEIQNIYNRIEKNFKDYLIGFSEVIGDSYIRYTNKGDFKDMGFLLLKRNIWDCKSQKVKDLSTQKIYRDISSMKNISIELFSQSQLIKFFKSKNIDISEKTVLDAYRPVKKISKDEKVFVLITKKEEVNESRKSNGPNFKRILIDDFVVYQGRNAESNDYITMEVADEEDLWFHAKGVPGSHVVIRVKDKLPPKDVIEKAAIIAAKNCKSLENKIKVVYCKKKFVSKRSGMNAGQVMVDYKNASEIIVTKT